MARCLSHNVIQEHFGTFGDRVQAGHPPAVVGHEDVAARRNDDDGTNGLAVFSTHGRASTISRRCQLGRHSRQ